MSEFILWYLTVTLIGVVSFPLAYRLLPALPDRGYSLNRALSLLAWGYFFWLLTSLGVTRNNPGGLLLALSVLLGLSYWAVRGISMHELLAWWRERRNLIIGVEILFLVAFAGWSIVRAANPEIQFTEKPMELAFINAITSSERFPPHDPWLSGYAISYYYFGYVLVAMLAKITAIPAGIAFNLGIALIFALSAIGLYGLIYNLLEIWENRGAATEAVAREQGSRGAGERGSRGAGELGSGGAGERGSWGAGEGEIRTEVPIHTTVPPIGWPRSWDHYLSWLPATWKVFWRSFTRGDFFGERIHLDSLLQLFGTGST